jgi:hypothetical protein
MTRHRPLFLREKIVLAVICIVALVIARLFAAL